MVGTTNNMKKAKGKGNYYSMLVRLFFQHRHLRWPIMKLIERKAHNALVKENPDNRPRKVQLDKVDYLMALLHSVDRVERQGLISRPVLDKLMNTLLDKVLCGRGEADEKAKQLGFKPPLFVLISPTKRCNLHCVGCYACSDSSAAAKLEWELFDRILTEKEQLWGSYFTVISGGEPFLWEDKGKDLIDMAKKHSSNFFMVYTNGTLITPEVAQRLAEVGNLSPAISVEGFEAETDARRGKGVFNRILKAMENLRNVGVPFGISVTATRHNAELITSDEFIDFFFDKQGATYGWIFQYMPIGRKHTLDLMVTPEQRLEMLKRTFTIVREKKIFIADFWNSGTVSNGCIAAGRSGGYFHIDWDGDITPCAFVPYATGNIREIYEKGGNLNDALFCPLLKKIREWQDEYGYAKEADETGNWLVPCVIRDHYDEFLKAATSCNAEPIDQEAQQALDDTEYHKGMVQYGKDYASLTEPIWNQEYLSGELAEVNK